MRGGESLHVTSTVGGSSKPLVSHVNVRCSVQPPRMLYR